MIADLDYHWLAQEQKRQHEEDSFSALACWFEEQGETNYVQGKELNFD